MAVAVAVAAAAAAAVGPSCCALLGDFSDGGFMVLQYARTRWTISDGHLCRIKKYQLSTINSIKSIRSMQNDP